MHTVNWDNIRQDFPILAQKRDGKPLIYFDNSATSQKPKAVLDAIQELYTTYNANIHRGVYHLSEETSARYEASKQTVAAFINAVSWQEIIYTRNTTESLNLAAYLLEKVVNPGDEILLSIMEHHSNQLPWMQLAKRKQAVLRYIPIDGEGNIQMHTFRQMVSPKTKILAITQVSNVLGSVNPVGEMGSVVKEAGGYVVVDGAQAVGSIPVDVAALNCDFYAFSGHKMLAPTGIGVLWGKRAWLETAEPHLYGGDMVNHVEQTSASYKGLPWKFEAGTSNYEGGIALGAAIEYLNKIGIDAIQMRKESLREYMDQALGRMGTVHIYGNSKHKAPIFAFTMEGIHPHDLASLLDGDNICIRAGNHCAQPLVDVLAAKSLARASLHFYNTFEEIDVFVESLLRIQKIFQHG